MIKVSCKLTVFFEDPFWVGIFERTGDGYLEAAKIVFGAEPKDHEIYDQFIKYFSKLRFSPGISDIEIDSKKVNPKRMQRLIKSQVLKTGAGTKAQEALKLQMQENKLLRKSFQKKRAEDEKQRQYELRQQKKKEKHKGR